MNEISYRPYNLIAELTYRCPLKCPYCSNPLDLTNYTETLTTEDWCSAFEQAEKLGVVHLGLTGGEPSTRSDLEVLVKHASELQLYTHLVTAGMPIDAKRLAVLAKYGLCSVQLSVQDSTPEMSDTIAGTKSFDRKRVFAEEVRALDLPLVLNVVLHRQNLENLPEIISMASDYGAHRLELANTQYHGWALKNRAALLPTLDQLKIASRVVQDSRLLYPEMEILFVLPDYYSERPKPCMGGWAQNTMIITPNGRVLPCHNAGTLTELEFWRIPENSLDDCWTTSPGMNTFRGYEWMKDPCRSCEHRERDFGGCRCQAFALTGDMAATDPACSLSPHHPEIERARDESIQSSPSFVYRDSVKKMGGQIQ